MKFRNINRRISTSTFLCGDWASFVNRKQGRASNLTSSAISGNIILTRQAIDSALSIHLANCLVIKTIAKVLSVEFPVVDMGFEFVRNSYIASQQELSMRAPNYSGNDIFSRAIAASPGGRKLLYSVPDVFDYFSYERDYPFQHKAMCNRVELFAHGLSRQSIMAQVLQDLRYPWLGRAAAENAPALIRSFWWRPPFGADRITVFVTPDNPTLLDSLNAEFPESFQTEWGQTLSVSFDPFHSRD